MLLVKSVVIVLLGLCACSGQEAEDYGNDQSVVSARKNQDVAILKQIHRHNEDGSYTYGYEGADGSFKIETKTQSGEVTGKYGYVDDLGKLRVVEYGANKHGFQPSGEGITVPPPTLVQLRTDEDEDDVTPEEERPRPAKRPSAAKPQKPLFRNDGFVQQQQQPIPNAVRSPAVADFDDSDSPAAWAVQPTDDDDANEQSWSRQSQMPAAARPRAPVSSPSYRPAVPARFGGTAARPKSPPPPMVGGSFAAVPLATDDGPSGSFQSVQDFGGSRKTASGRRDSSAGRQMPEQHSYQTYEDQEPVTVSQLYQPVNPVRRNGGARNAALPSSSAAGRVAPRQMRTSGILDQLAQQYALPESGSPVSHSVSFGLDQ